MSQSSQTSLQNLSQKFLDENQNLSLGSSSVGTSHYWTASAKVLQIYCPCCETSFCPHCQAVFELFKAYIVAGFWQVHIRKQEHKVVVLTGGAEREHSVSLR